MHVLCIVDTQGRKTSMGYTSYTCIIGKRETNDKMFGMTNSIPGMQEACETAGRLLWFIVKYGPSCVLLFIFILDKVQTWGI